MVKIFIEELKQKLAGIAVKLRRYQEERDIFRQNMVQNNQQQFYEELNQDRKRPEDEMPRSLIL